LPDPSKNFGEDINDASLNLELVRFITENYYVAFQSNLVKSAHLDYNGRNMVQMYLAF
jgi:hypothetical protein